MMQDCTPIWDAVLLFFEGLWACGLAGLRACDLAGLRPCGLRPCGLATLRACVGIVYWTSMTVESKQQAIVSATDTNVL